VVQDTIVQLGNRKDVCEIEADLILLASLYPEKSESLLFQGSRLSEIVVGMEGALERTAIVRGFYLRVARLVSQIWNCPVFTERPKKNGKNKWKMSQTFEELPNQIIDQLRKTGELLDDYCAMKLRSLDDIRFEGKQRFEIERSDLKDLKLWMTLLIETLTLIAYLSQQKSVALTAVFHELAPKGASRDEIERGRKLQRRLDTSTFGSMEPDAPSLMEALLEFLSVFFKRTEPTTEGNLLAAGLATSCPSFIHAKEARLKDIPSVLEAIRTAPDDLKQLIPIISNVVAECAHGEVDFGTICGKLISADASSQAGKLGHSELVALTRIIRLS
jgi:hypothetical protein